MRNLILAALLCSLLPISALAEELPPFVVSSNTPHQMQILESGLAAFQKRLEFISRAKSSIDLEYFIYNTDRAGRIFTQALVRKRISNPEVKIRLLLDGSSTVLQLDSFYVTELAKYGVEVRYYNPAPLIALITTQYRNHRKVMIIDGKEAITGGRNIGDEYFDLSEKFNFLDRDIWIKGPVVAPMAEAFNAYWNDERVKTVDAEVPPVQYYYDNGRESEYQAALATYNQKTQLATDFITETAHERAIRTEVDRLGKAKLADSSLKGSCNRVQSVTDLPGFERGFNRWSSKRRVREAMLARVNSVPEGEHLYVESPYFIVERNGSEAIEGLAERHVKTTLLTNSLTSTDAFYVAAHFLPRVIVYASKSEGEIYVYSGRPLPDTTYVKDRQGRELARNAVWGIHAKTLIFDRQSFTIGTFNIDPRSANLNTEMMIVCEDSPTLTRALQRHIENRIGQSQKLSGDGTAVSGPNPLEGAGFSKVLLFFFSLMPSTLLEFLL